MDIHAFVGRLIETNVIEKEIAIAILWYKDRNGFGDGVPIDEIADLIFASGGSKVNNSRLHGKLESDKRVSKTGKKSFKINGRSRDALSEIFSPLTGPIKPKNTGSVIPEELFENARSYTQSVVHQINGSYDHALFDCCAVMSRRLFETIAIEAFENQGAVDAIRNNNGDLLMLSGIVTILKQEKQFVLGRQTKQALDKLKNIGDWSAHSRTFIARKHHIDDIKDHLFHACSELLVKAGQD